MPSRRQPAGEPFMRFWCARWLEDDAIRGVGDDGQRKGGLTLAQEAVYLRLCLTQFMQPDGYLPNRRSFLVDAVACSTDVAAELLDVVLARFFRTTKDGTRLYSLRTRAEWEHANAKTIKAIAANKARWGRQKERLTGIHSDLHLDVRMDDPQGSPSARKRNLISTLKDDGRANLLNAENTRGSVGYEDIGPSGHPSGHPDGSSKRERERDLGETTSLPNAGDPPPPPSPPVAALPPEAPRRIPPARWPDWTAAYGRVHTNHWGENCVPDYGGIVQHLGPLRDKHGDELTLARWDAYVRSRTDPQFCRPQRFAEGFDHWGRGAATATPPTTRRATATDVTRAAVDQIFAEEDERNARSQDVHEGTPVDRRPVGPGDDSRAVQRVLPGPRRRE